MRLSFVAVAALLLGCPPLVTPRDAGTGGGGVATGGGSTTGAGGGDRATGGGSGGGVAGAGGGLAGQQLLTRLAGLWSGPATMTRLGNFPMMTMDLRPVGDSFLFGQTDLDLANLLRFGFNIETYSGNTVLAYRNGGYFGGVLRDSRMSLVDSTADSWHFCAVSGGCASIDALFTQTGTELILDAKVSGQQHLYWDAQRLETRTVPAVFPGSTASQGDGSEPWPAMATVQVTASWGTPLTAPADVWLVLTTTACLPTFACHPSRAIMLTAAAGATGATVTLTSVHAAAYDATVVLDLDQNFATTFAPSHGDKIAVDQGLTVPGTGTATLSVTTSITVP